MNSRINQSKVASLIKTIKMYIDDEKIIKFTSVEKWFLEMLLKSMEDDGYYIFHVPIEMDEFIALMCLELAYNSLTEFKGKFFNGHSDPFAVLMTNKVSPRKKYLSIKTQYGRIADLNHGVGYISSTGKIKPYGNCKSDQIKMIFCPKIELLDELKEFDTESCLALLLLGNDLKKLNKWLLKDYLAKIDQTNYHPIILVTDDLYHYNVKDFIHKFSPKIFSYQNYIEKKQVYMIQNKFTNGEPSIPQMTPKFQVENLLKGVTLKLIQLNWTVYEKIRLSILGTFEWGLAELEKNTIIYKLSSKLVLKIKNLLAKLENLLCPISIYDLIAEKSFPYITIIQNILRIIQQIEALSYRYKGVGGKILSMLIKDLKALERFVKENYNVIPPKGVYLLDVLSKIKKNQCYLIISANNIHNKATKLFISTNPHISQEKFDQFSFTVSSKIKNRTEHDLVIWYGSSYWDKDQLSRIKYGITSNEILLHYTFSKSEITKKFSYMGYVNSRYFKQSQFSNHEFEEIHSIEDQYNQVIENIDIKSAIRNHLIGEVDYRQSSNDAKLQSREEREVDDEIQFLIEGGYKITCFSEEKGYKEIKIPKNNQILSIPLKKVSPIKVNPNKLTPGDLVVLIDGDTHTDLTNRIVNKLYEDPIWKMRVTIRDIWEESLNNLLLENITPRIILEKIQKKGSKITTVRTIESWIDGDTIGPRDLGDIKRVANSFSISKLINNYDEICESIRKIRSVRNRVRNLISKKAKIQLQKEYSGKLPKTKNKGDLILIEDFDELMQVMRIEEIEYFDSIEGDDYYK